MDTFERLALIGIAVAIAVLLFRLWWRWVNRSYDRQEAREERQMMKEADEFEQFAQWERELED